jgi:hypothetical protein
VQYYDQTSKVGREAQTARNNHAAKRCPEEYLTEEPDIRSKHDDENRA